MKINKLKLTLLTLALSVVCSFSALAATGSIVFSDPSATVGSEVNVTMKVKSEDDTLSRADITVAYDTNLLQFESGTDSDGGAGTVRVHGATNGAGSGTLEYNLKFKTLAAGTGAVKVATQEVYDSSESLVDVTHVGSSSVNIVAAAEVSNNSVLQTLTVSPGTLSPEFKVDTTDYSVSVGTSVDTLAINAIPAEPAATVSVSGNEALNMGENSVVITVTAPDQTTQTVYNLKVTKEEGGPAVGEPITTETQNEGVKLSAKEKSITIMNPGSDVAIPEGFAESTIDIDGHQVKGWVWKTETDHNYVIVYGMNDAGELNFYRYDLQEKTIQKYFEDPVESKLKADAENYPAVVEKYDALVTRYNNQFILSCVLGVASLVLLIFIIVLLSGRKKNGGNGGNSPRPRSDRSRDDDEDGSKSDMTRDDSDMDKTIDLATLKRAQMTEGDHQDLEITRVISRAPENSGSDLDIENLEDDVLSTPDSSNDDLSGQTAPVPNVAEATGYNPEVEPVDEPTMIMPDLKGKKESLDIEDL